MLSSCRTCYTCTATRTLPVPLYTASGSLFLLPLFCCLRAYPRNDLPHCLAWAIYNTLPRFTRVLDLLSAYLLLRSPADPTTLLRPAFHLPSATLRHVPALHMPAAALRSRCAPPSFLRHLDATTYALHLQRHVYCVCRAAALRRTAAPAACLHRVRAPPAHCYGYLFTRYASCRYTVRYAHCDRHTYCRGSALSLTRVLCCYDGAGFLSLPPGPFFRCACARRSRICAIAALFSGLPSFAVLYLNCFFVLLGSAVGPYTSHGLYALCCCTPP